MSFCSFGHDHDLRSPVFEMRTYTTYDGKLDALDARFRDHTTALFEKHGMKNIGYWIPTDQANTLIYVLSHKSREAAGESWKAFINDPQWKAAYQASIADGKLVSNIDSVFMNATDYSDIR
ncbi:NIPSNAP family protein [Ningiella sp. W23]|uniref:NIPSNAP family protein n=1 Tax=Ningiella sp. W23 TaxID=3023715 RepID=UPI0039F4C541